MTNRKKALSWVSVIITTYNRSNMLPTAVESVLAQTYPAIEIIVVDDGSTDDTKKVMKQYVGRVTYIRQDNQGLAAARNTGIRASSGQYINVLDDDDFFMPTKIERQVQVLDTQPDTALVNCGHYYVNEKGALLYKVIPSPGTDTLKELVCGCFIVAHAPLIRRQCLDEIGLFDQNLPWFGKYCEDWDLWLRMARSGYRFVHIQEPLCAYRIHGDSQLTNINKLEQGSFGVLDRVFAVPDLPSEVVAEKSKAYGINHFWTSCRYYAIGEWSDAQRNLTQALTLYPDFADPKALIQSLADAALSLRVEDPIKFATDVFDHLPSCASEILLYRSNSFAQIYAGLAIQNYAANNLTEAKQQLAQAITLDPTILTQPKAFVNLLSHYAMRLPVNSSTQFIETVFQNLPTNAGELRHIRPHALGEVNIAGAFQDYSAGLWLLTVRRILTGVWYRPTWLGNRGILSIFVKSLFGIIMGSR
jgi:glycosyltransferase involved in cell wall biosynthesis